MCKDTFIVSRADEHGNILYANQEFIQLTGYLEEELIGINHNIIRHPDMPKAIFKLLWETVGNGKEFNGYIKNLCKNGMFYWVFATIATSITNEGVIYYSVRKKPNKTALKTIIPLYQSMLEAELKSPNDQTFSDSTNLLFDKFSSSNLTYDQYVLSL